MQWCRNSQVELRFLLCTDYLFILSPAGVSQKNKEDVREVKDLSVLQGSALSSLFLLHFCKNLASILHHILRAILHINLLFDILPNQFLKIFSRLKLYNKRNIKEGGQ